MNYASHGSGTVKQTGESIRPHQLGVKLRHSPVPFVTIHYNAKVMLWVIVNIGVLEDLPLRLMAFRAGLLFVCACSGGGSDSASVPAINQAPTVVVTGVTSGDEGVTLTLSGSNSRDPDGSIAAFVWEQTAGPTARLVGDLTADVRVQLPLVNRPTDITLRLTATDDDGASSSEIVTLSVRPQSKPSNIEILSDFDGQVRTYTVYTPETYMPGNPAVMVLHGGGGSMRVIQEPTRPTQRWFEVADRDGLLLILPNGFNEQLQDGLGDDQSWADIRNDQTGRISLQDDEGFLMSVLDEVEAARAFNREALFVTGSSNGGMMTFRMLINQGRRFAGGASFIGGMPEQFVPLPVNPTPVMILAGTEDPLILFEGGPVANGGSSTRSIPETVDYWIEATMADRTSVLTTTLPDLTDDGCLIEESVYTTAVGAPAVTYYEMVGGGHSAPDTTPSLRTPAARLLIGNQCSDAHGIDLADMFFDSIP